VELQLSELPRSAGWFKSSGAAHSIFSSHKREWLGVVSVECLAGFASTARRCSAIASPRESRNALTQGISLAPALESFGGIAWSKPPRKLSPLLRRDGLKSGLQYQAVDVVGKPPRFMKGQQSKGLGHSVGYRILDEKSGGRLLFLPDVAVLDELTIDVLSDCDVLLFDGTFWSENEMQEIGVGNLSAKQMGHVPISGPQGSLKQLARLRVARKIYTHINNTNPIVRKGSPERAAVLAAGVEVGRDGMELMI
jgi:pyrroloquinoline quinone biosynthesis protein B